jgi:hypothetical protein
MLITTCFGLVWAIAGVQGVPSRWRASLIGIAILVSLLMQGFDCDRARNELRIPDDFRLEAMAVVGRPGPKELLSERLQARETPNDRRKVSESIFEGPFKSK